MALALTNSAVSPWREELSIFWQAHHAMTGAQTAECTTSEAYVAAATTRSRSRSRSKTGAQTAECTTAEIDVAAVNMRSRSRSRSKTGAQTAECTIAEIDVAAVNVRSRSRSRSKTGEPEVAPDKKDASRQMPATPMNACRRDSGHSFTWQRRKTPTSASFNAWEGGTYEDGIEDKENEHLTLDKQVAQELQKKSKAMLTRGRWDQRPEHVEKEIREKEAQTMTCLLLQQGRSDQWTLRKRRTAFVGGLPRFHSTTESVSGLLVTMFQQLPDFQERYAGTSAIIEDVTMPPQGRHNEGSFAFVVFIDEVLASTAINMDGFCYGSQKVTVRRVTGYTPPVFGELPPLDTEPLRLLGFLPAKEMALQFVAQSENVESGVCELYFGNLNGKQVNENVLKALLLPVCDRLPEFDRASGPSLKKICMGNGNSHSIVEFQNEQMAMRIARMFDDTNFFGRKMRVRRRLDYGSRGWMQGVLQVKDLKHIQTLAVASDAQENSSN